MNSIIEQGIREHTLERVQLKKLSEDKINDVVCMYDASDAAKIILSRKKPWSRRLVKSDLIGAILLQQRFYKKRKAIKHSKMYRNALDKLGW